MLFRSFLEDGDKVKAYVFFKGRSILFKEQGEVLLLRFANDLEDFAKVDQMPVLEGKRMTIQLSPKKKEMPKKPAAPKPVTQGQKAEKPEAGGLDGRFFAHMEEIDLCWRLRARGRQLACIPQSVVFHVGGATLKKENPRKTFLNFRNNLVMLYKNLPQEDLASVMRVRAVLDYVAAFSFMLKGQLPNALAVFRARRAYHSLRTSLAASRKENLKKTTLAVIPERTKNSILAQFYLHGKKFFSQL